ncbi:zinc-finger homeodomain protein 3-like [Chenopodium quinoa]|uniref:zinc-finger homeodomain protein 3-like n=1 Tax=Chenopodium quinoa TaxID=63459 RepID=UPI000B78C2F2|nr:zinc-finger homeodomain protein 3-like [Chenopodium quinoa]
MELSHEEEVEIPMPINSAYVGFHGYHHGSMAHHRYHHHHHNHDPSSSSTQNQHNNNIILPSNNSNGATTNSTITTTTATTAVIDEDDHSLLGQNHSHCNNNDNNNDDDDDDSSTKATKKKMMMVRYKECQKNHAACMGGNARDGCGEFMPSSGEEGSIESLICSVCNCHRNFHRKEFEGEHNMNMNMMMISTHNSSYSPFYPSSTTPHLLNNKSRKVILGDNGVGYPTISGQVVPRSLGINNISTCYHNNHHYNHNHNQGVKKRFRTKFSQEQKEKMLEFAEKVGWKFQRQEGVEQFCQQIGIKRRVLKVWMHNNKHSFAKKNDMIIDNNDINNSS